MTNGQPVDRPGGHETVVHPDETVALRRSQDRQEVKATVERCDVCAAPAAAVIGEAVVAIELAKAVLDKFGGDSVGEMKRNLASYREACKRW